MTLTKEWLELADAIGVSGAEEPVRQVVRRRLDTQKAQSQVDAMGNLWTPGRLTGANLAGAGVVGGDQATAAPRLVLSAPLDEPGLVVTHVDQGGWLRVDRVGGPVQAVRWAGRCVTFRPAADRERTAGAAGAVSVAGAANQPKGAAQTTVTGVLALDRQSRAAAAGHEVHEEEWQVEDLFVDIGADGAPQAREQVPLGSTGVLAVPPARRLGDSRWLGRVVGRRLLVETLLEVGAELGPAQSDAGLQTGLLFAAQSLLGGRGVEAALAELRPEYYVPLLPIPAEDWPAHSRAGEMQLGAGPVVVVQEGPGVSDRGLLELARQVAAKEQIPLQWRAAAGGRRSNDLAEGLWARGGVRTLGLGLVVRMQPGMAEMVDERDAAALARLLVGIVPALAALGA